MGSDLFSNLKERKKVIHFNKMDFPVFHELEDDNFWEEVAKFAEKRLEEEQEFLKQEDPKIPWYEVVVNLVFSLSEENLRMSKEINEMKEALKENIDRIAQRLGESSK